MKTQSVSENKRRVIIRQLVEGQEAATQLNLLLHNPFQIQPSLSSHQLIANVLRSFTHAISIITSLQSPSAAPGPHLPHRNLLNSGQHESPVVGSGNDPTCGNSGKSRKRSQKGGRGCYKRRKSVITWTTVSNTTDDKHAWRKYGQKEIQNSEFPRNYFRCRHKYDQGCKAIKQVQRDEEHPDMYRITYIGVHTCNATPKATDSVTDSITLESYFLNFDPGHSMVPNEDQDHHNSSPSLTIKQEFPKEDTPNDVTDHDKLDDPNLWTELKDFEPSKHAIVPLQMESDDNNCDDSQGMDMEFGVESVHFGTDFHFDEIQLL